MLRRGTSVIRFLFSGDNTSGTSLYRNPAPSKNSNRPAYGSRWEATFHTLYGPGRTWTSGAIERQNMKKDGKRIGLSQHNTFG